MCYAVKYLVPTNTSNWARCVCRIKSQVRTGVNQYRLLRVLPNRLTPIYSKNYYEEENYLTVGTVSLNTQLLPIVRVQYFGTSVHLVREYVSTWVHLVYSLWLVMWLSYPLSYSFTNSISPAFCVLTANLFKFSLSTCTIRYIKSVIPAPSSPASFLKIILISKLLIRGVQCSHLIE